jgi:predicted alpha/beta hydrolase
MSEDRAPGEALDFASADGEPLDFASADGEPLRARAFAPHGAPWAAVLVAPAIGVEAAYYAPFAAWLAEQGAATLVFDYRGVGASRPAGSLRRVHADLDTWAQDEDAALRRLGQRWPGLPLLVVGNSLGAQLAGALAARERIDGLLAVSMGSGYVGHLAPGFRWQARAFLHVVMPLATTLCGYFPGAALRTVGDLPAGAAWQWRRWCLSPEYLLSAEGRHAQYRAAAFPLISVYASDDELLAEDGARMMFAAHGNGRAFEVLQPADGERIGHLGVFKPRHRARHWPRLVHHLRSFQA